MELACKIITLERTPDRLATFWRNNRNLEMEIEVVHGVDGQRLERSELVDSGLMEAGTSWSNGAIGAALSHRELWLECAENDTPMLVLEDDAYVAAEAMRALERILVDAGDWDITFLGYNTDSCLDVQLFSDLHFRGHFSAAYPTHEQILTYLEEPVRRQAVRVRNVFGLGGYAISPEGARHFLSTCFPLRSVPVEVPALGRVLRAYTLDCLMNATFATCSAYAVIPPLVLTRNDPANSTLRD